MLLMLVVDRARREGEKIRARKETIQELRGGFRSSLFVLGCVQETWGQEKDNTETGLSGCAAGGK